MFADWSAAPDRQSTVEPQCGEEAWAPQQETIKTEPQKDLAAADSGRAAESASMFDDCNVAAYRSKINSGSAVIHQKDDGQDVSHFFFH